MSKRNFTANSPCSNHDLNEETLCRYCDSEEIINLSVDLTVEKYGDEYNKDQFDEVYSEIYSSTTLCRSCAMEELADFRDDD